MTLTRHNISASESAMTFTTRGTFTHDHFQMFHGCFSQEAAADPGGGDAEPPTGGRVMTGCSVKGIKILKRSQTQGSAKVEKQTGCPSGTKLSLGQRQPSVLVGGVSAPDLPPSSICTSEENETASQTGSRENTRVPSVT